MPMVKPRSALLKIEKNAVKHRVNFERLQRVAALKSRHPLSIYA